MGLLLALVIALPVALLVLGVLLGLGLGRVLPRLLARLGLGRQPEAAGACPVRAPGKASSEPQLHSIHVIASSASTPPPVGPARGVSQSTPSPLAASRPAPVLPPDSADSLQPSPAASPLSYHHRRGRSSMELGRLMRAGTSVLSQVMEDLDTRSALMRLMSDGVQMLPSPQAVGAPLFSPPSGIPMPAGEVHMDEIDLLDCIGRGGYGAVYKASWRQAPVAVKYIVCRTDDHDSLGRAIREVVLSKKMSHPNVVQCYSWTVLTEPDKQSLPPSPGHAAGGSTRRSLDTTFLAAQPAPGSLPQQGSLGRQGSLRRITELSAHEELAGEATAAMPPSPFAATQRAVASELGPQEPVAGSNDSLPMRISSKQSTESGSGKSQVQQDEDNSPAIAAVRPADLPTLITSAPIPVPGGGGSSALVGDVHDDAETPAAPPAVAPDSRTFGGSLEEALLVQFQALANEMYLSRSASLRLSHQPTNSSSFSDVNGGGGFMLGSSSRGDTQQSAPESEWASRQQSPSSSAAVTPSAAAAADGNNNPFRRSRLSRAASNAAVGEASEGGASKQPSELPSVPSEGAEQQQQQEEEQQQQPPGEQRAESSPELEGSFQPPPYVPSEGAMYASEAVEAPSEASVGPQEAALLPSVPPLPALQQSRDSSSGCELSGPPSSYGLHRSSTQEGHPCADSGTLAARSSGLYCSSTISLTAWKQQGSSSGPEGGSSTQPASRTSPPPADCSPAASSRPSFHLWRAEAPAAGLSTVPRIPSRLGPRPFVPIADALHEQAGSGADTGRSSLAALPPGSPPAGRALGLQLRASSYSSLAPLQGQEEGSPAAGRSVRVCSFGNLAMFQAGEEGPGGHRVGSPRGSPGAGRALPPELQVGSRENSRSSRKQRRVDEVIDSELAIDSRTDSFNSEEGFGSPVRNRCGGVKSVFELEGLHLSSQEALMVVVMEFCDLGALRKALKRRAFVPHGRWTFQTTYRALLRTAQEIAKGMEYIHGFDIVHGDLKPGNVLLKTHKVDRRGYIAKVSDFGLSRPINNGETHITLGSAMGTIAYTAPEAFSTNIVKKPSDVYAFGIMLWEMFYCKDVYSDLLDGQICVGVSDGTLRPEFDDSCPLPYRRLAERCWHHDPNARPHFKEIVTELVQIEVDFRNLTHRQNSSKLSLSAGSGQNSAANSRPASPDVLLRSKSRAGDADFARALMQ